MKNVYLAFAIVGFILPNIFVTIVSIETGNILLWLNPAATIAGMFDNNISTIFVIDLFVAVFVFFFWSFHEGKKLNIKNLWLIWVLTMLFGLAGSFPLFLYWREKHLNN